MLCRQPVCGEGIFKRELKWGVEPSLNLGERPSRCRKPVVGCSTSLRFRAFCYVRQQPKNASWQIVSCARDQAAPGLFQKQPLKDPWRTGHLSIRWPVRCKTID